MFLFNNHLHAVNNQIIAAYGFKYIAWINNILYIWLIVIKYND